MGFLPMEISTIATTYSFMTSCGMTAFTDDVTGSIVGSLFALIGSEWLPSFPSRIRALVLA